MKIIKNIGIFIGLSVISIFIALGIQLLLTST